MEREQLVGAGSGVGGDLRNRLCMRWRCRAARVCGRQFHDGGRQRGQLHRAMEREQLVGAGFGDGRLELARMCLRWRCRAARCMPAAISRRRAASRPITSRNGMGAVGRRWVRGSAAMILNPYCLVLLSVDALVVSGGRLYAGGWFMTAGTNVSAYAAEAIIAPTVLFTANPTNGVAPLTVNFTFSGNDSGGNTIVSWNWNFGDGANSTNRKPAGCFHNNAGTFQPGLVATNNLGFTVMALYLQSSSRPPRSLSRLYRPTARLL